MTATEIYDTLQEHRKVTDCVSWIAQFEFYEEVSRNTLFRAVKRDKQREPYTARQRFYLQKFEEFVKDQNLVKTNQVGGEQ
jgi:hypothetical protein